MSDFLTVEDINGSLINYDNVNSLFYVDMNGMTDKDWFRCDFVECEVSGEGQWNFRVTNTLWTGGFVLLDENNQIIELTSNQYTYSNGILTITYAGDWSKIKVCFYLSSFYDVFTIDYMLCVFDMKPAHFNKDNVFNTLYVFGQRPTYFNLIINGSVIDTFTIDGALLTIDFPTDYNGKYLIESVNGDTRFYGSVKQMPNLYNFASELTGSSDVHVNTKNSLSCNIFVVNNQELTRDIKFKAYLDDTLIGSDVQTVTGDDDNIAFDFYLDLSNDDHVGIRKIIVEVETDIIQFYEYRVNATIPTVTTQSELRAAITNQTPIIYMGGNIALTGSDLIINYPVTITGYGEGISLNMNSHSFKVSDDLTLDNLKLHSAKTLIRQQDSCNITIKDCTIYNCTNDENEASVIEYNSKNLNTTGKITITDCTLRDNQIPYIQHQNHLTVDKSSFSAPVINDDVLSRSLPSFIHQKAGHIKIDNSTFNIILNTDYYTSNHIDIGLNMAAFLFGDNVQLNGMATNEITDWTNSFFNHGNSSTILAKYYYKELGANVIVEPTLSYRSLCYGLAGEEYIFKVNSTIRRL